VVCIGSLNVDLVFQVDRMPVSGESVSGRGLERHLGGKGLNQALAAARAGSDVALVGAVGDDDGGAWMLSELATAGVDSSGTSRRSRYAGSLPRQSHSHRWRYPRPPFSARCAPPRRLA